MLPRNDRWTLKSFAASRQATAPRRRGPTIAHPVSSTRLPPHDAAAALRLPKVLEECRQMRPAEAEEWRRRITGWARLNAVGTERQPDT